MSELAQVVAYVFRQLGRDAVGRNEFKQFLAFRLGWYPPAQATQLLERALQAGLVGAEGDTVRLAFAAEAVELPLNFRGGARALEEPLAGAPAARPVPAPAPAPEADPALDERAGALRDLARGRLSEEAARLLAARERGDDVRAQAAAALTAMGLPRAA